MRKAILTATLLLMTLGAVSVSAQDYVAPQVTISKEKVRLNGKVYYSHVVLEKQTLYSISKAYGVSINDIMEANPSIADTGLQKNAVIMIPVAPSAPVTAPAAPDEKTVEVTPAPAPEAPAAQGYKEHIRKWYENLDDIARKYKVSKEDIMRFNSLTSETLSRRQVLKIPTEPLLPAETVDETAEPAPADSLSTSPEEPKEDTVVVSFFPKSCVNVALMLPLTASGAAGDMNMDFYSGVLLAVKNLEEKGISTELHVHDLTKGTIPGAYSLGNTDFILGPISSKDIRTVLDYTGKVIPLISPLDQKAAEIMAEAPLLVQAPPRTEAQYEDIVSWVREDRTLSDNVLLIKEKGVQSAASEAISGNMGGQFFPFQTLSYAMSEGTSIPTRLPLLLSKAGTNRVVIASDREEFVSDVLRNITIMQGKGYEVVVYATSKIRSFDIDPTVLHELALHVSSSYYVDYSARAVKRFLLEYRALYNTEPSQFAFQGYDIASYFITLVSKYGDGWRIMMPNTVETGLHMEFRFSEGVNKGVRRIVYRKDYTTGSN